MMKNFIPFQKFYLFLLWSLVGVGATNLAFADFETTEVFSAKKVRETQGQYCSSKGIVDIHAHVGCISDGGKTCFISERMKNTKVAGVLNKYKQLFKAFNISEEALKTKGNPYFFEAVSGMVQESTCLSSVVLLALDAHYEFNSGTPDLENTDFYVSNDYVAEQVKKHSNLFWGASINPFRKDFREELLKVKKNGAVLVKLIPPIQGFPVSSEIKEVQERLREFYSLLKKLNLPLLIHLDEEGTFSPELERKFRSFVGVLGIRFALETGATVVVAHAASRKSISFNAPKESEDSYHDLLRLMDEPTYNGLLYADISALPTIWTREDHLCRVMTDYQGKMDRLLWGSDYPLNSAISMRKIFVGSRCGSGLFKSLDQSFALATHRNQWDRGIFIQKQMGAPDSVFNNTRKFLLERKLILEDQKGNLRPRN